MLWRTWMITRHLSAGIRLGVARGAVGQEDGRPGGAQKAVDIENGTSMNGTWINATWINGTWINGTWINGTWINGTWINGVFMSGVSLAGTSFRGTASGTV